MNDPVTEMQLARLDYTRLWLDQGILTTELASHGISKKIQFLGTQQLRQNYK